MGATNAPGKHPKARRPEKGYPTIQNQIESRREEGKIIQNDCDEEGHNGCEGNREQLHSTLDKRLDGTKDYSPQ